MIQNVLHRLGGIEAYGIHSICLFFVVFLGVLVWAFGQRASRLNRIAQIPLEEEPARDLSAATAVAADPHHE